MATSVPPVRRVRCDHPGCGRSYLRSEHLNRHRLTRESAYTLLWVVVDVGSVNGLAEPIRL